jgi:hydrogenase maturation protease
MQKIGVIGLGNPLRRDDSIGLILLDYLQRQTKEFKEKITFVDGGTGGMTLLHLLPRFDIVLLIDAVDFKGRPGEVRVFTFEQVQSNKPPIVLSTHETDFLKVLSLSKDLHELPQKLLIFGVQPYDLSHGTGLSEKIISHLDGLKRKVHGEVQILVEKQ